MILYHVSSKRIESIQINDNTENLDFGKGFYTTSSDERVKELISAYRKRGIIPYICRYEFDENILSQFKVKEFKNADEEWLDFVCMNRSGIKSEENFDIVIGAVANDDVYRTVQIYSDGFLTKEQAVDALKVKKLFNQYVFASEKAVSKLKFITSEAVENE